MNAALASLIVLSLSQTPVQVVTSAKVVGQDKHGAIVFQIAAPYPATRGGKTRIPARTTKNSGSVALTAMVILPPVPDGDAPDFQAGESVELDPEGKFMIVRRLEALARAKELYLQRIPREQRDSIMRIREHKPYSPEKPRELNPETFRTGDTGQLSGKYRVLQIVDGGKSLRLADVQDITVRHVFLLETTTKHDVADNQVITLPGQYLVDRTTTRSTVGGAGATVYVVKTWKDRAAEQAAEKAAEQNKLTPADFAALDKFENDWKAKLDEHVQRQLAALKKTDFTKGQSDTATRHENAATALLVNGKKAKEKGDNSEARRWFQKVVDQHDGTKAAEEAKKLLKD